MEGSQNNQGSSEGGVAEQNHCSGWREMSCITTVVIGEGGVAEKFVMDHVKFEKNTKKNIIFVYTEFTLDLFENSITIYNIARKIPYIPQSVGSRFNIIGVASPSSLAARSCDPFLDCREVLQPFPRWQGKVATPSSLAG